MTNRGPSYIVPDSMNQIMYNIYVISIYDKIYSIPSLNKERNNRTSDDEKDTDRNSDRVNES